MTRKLRWKKIPKGDLHTAEAFLKSRERFCVAACSRFLQMQEGRGGHLWHLPGAEGEISSLLLLSRHALFPVFDKSESRREIPAPRFLNRFLGKVHIHALQGQREDIELLESLMESQGYFAAQRIDYDLMSLDSSPREGAFRAGPPGLVLRPPLPGDEEQLFALQAAYEQEEVLPNNAVFNPASCRLNLSKILSLEQVLVAELDGQVVGKINTSAKSFTRCQVGGVYVRPDCRGQGIAAKMSAVFFQGLLSQGMGITLFVKKRNAAAAAVYRKAGFNILAGYRICYY